MKLKTFYEALNKIVEQYPDTLDLDVKIEYPTDFGSSSEEDIHSIDWDESDFYISYYEYV